MRRWFNIFSNALWLVAVLSVVEILVRGLQIKKIISPYQIVVAAMTSFAVLGLTVGVLCVLWAIVDRLTVGRSGDGRRLFSPVDACWGTLIFAIVACTDVCGAIPYSRISSISVALVGGCVATVLSRMFRVRNIKGVSRLQQVIMIVLWLGSLAFAGRLVQTTRAHLANWVHPNATESMTQVRPRPNVVLVVLDTLRADRLEANGGTGLTPVLDDLARQSFVFPNAISTAPWTLPSHASLFTGTYPWTHRVSWGHQHLDEGLPTLAELLTAQGYDTFAISNNQLLTAAFGYARGFDAFIETSTDGQLSAWYVAMKCGGVRRLAWLVGLPAMAAEDAGSAWTNWLMDRRLQRQAVECPFFAFLNYYEVHDPYQPPHTFKERVVPKALHAACEQVSQDHRYLKIQACRTDQVYSKEEIKLLEWLYNAEVAYQDAAIGELMKVLDHRGYLENSWVIITADHGELFGEHNMVHHTAGSHFNLLHVPLLVRPPGGTPQRIVDAPVQPVDIFASVVQIAGAQVPASAAGAIPLPINDSNGQRREYALAYSYGASISAMLAGLRRRRQADLCRWLTWQTSIFHDGQFLQIDDRGVLGLFNVLEDPKMDHNLINAQPERAQALVEEVLRLDLPELQSKLGGISMSPWSKN